MSETDIQQYKASVKNFQQRVINRSVSFLLIFDKLADCVLECCRADINPNTLSLLSFIHLPFLAIFHPGPNLLGFGLTALCLLIHQIMDIANKKQAYRLQKFSLKTFYIDHIYDSLSCSLIVFIITTLMEFEIGNKWMCMFIFGLLPFYLAHVAMYYTGYMEFQLVNPSTQGLLMLQLLFLGCMAKNDLLQLQILQTVAIYQILFGFSCLWLITFLVKSFWDIQQSNKQTDQIPFKNLFVIVALGYIFLETAIISDQLLENKLFFLFLSLLNMTHFSILIGNLLMSYGSSSKFTQISVNTLLVTTSIVAIYTVCFLIPMNKQIQQMVGIIVIGCLSILQILYFLFEHRRNIKLINQAVNS